jgi:N-carbamoyl-L-amino-acid hydrolase
VPARVSFSIDFRHPDQAILDRLGDRIAATAEAAATPCALSVREIFYREPCVFPDLITGAIARAAQALDLPSLRLASGAFHDANFLADVCPTGMIFVPCAGGISHSPKESATPADLAAGARVLTATIVDLAGLD